MTRDYNAQVMETHTHILARREPQHDWICGYVHLDGTPCTETWEYWQASPGFGMHTFERDAVLRRMGVER